MPTSSNAVGVCDRDESDVTKARACAMGVEDGDDTAGAMEVCNSLARQATGWG